MKTGSLHSTADSLRLADLARSMFPDGFVFGAATSAYQIEGNAFGGCGPSHWDAFAATPGKVANGENGAIACDHYHRFESDLDLVRECNLGAYRFSFAWPRIMPTGKRPINEEGLDFYDRLIDACLARGLEAHATLYHWDLPLALAEKGGWQNRDTANRFADYAELVANRFADRLTSIATFNEPWCVTWLSHFEGHHAPGLTDISATARSMHLVLVAHAQAMEVLRDLGCKNLGIVLNHEYSEPANDSEAERAAAYLYDGIYNRWFLDGLFKGAYPTDVLEHLHRNMPDGYEADMEAISRPLDFLGINYYTRSVIGPGDGGAFPDISKLEGPLEKTAMGWEIYPDGLHHFLTRIAREYTGDLPLLVTENGLASDDQLSSGSVADDQRDRYLAVHLQAVFQAIADGAPVKGYFAWSLLDNFEWAFGYGKRFGLVHVDFETQKRTPKQSWHALKTMLER